MTSGEGLVGLSQCGCQFWDLLLFLSYFGVVFLNSSGLSVSRYKENVQKLSVLHKDRPVDPLDLSVYWTEYVMRHKGAKHLKSAVHDLSWIQYFCLDVIGLLAIVVLLFGILTIRCMKLCYRKLSSKRKQD